MMFKRFSVLGALWLMMLGSLSCAHNNVMVILLAGEAVTKYGIGSQGPGGGIVFYITPSSEGLHGLEVAPVNQSSVHHGVVTK
ncbi:MAG: hypothetical protein ACI9J2_001175 [Saprospiraceae bacterium]|jgi:hypothetical protein